MAMKAKTKTDLAARICPLLLLDASVGVVPLDHRINERNHGTKSRFQSSSRALRTKAGVAAFIELCEAVIGRDQDWKIVEVKTPAGGQKPIILIDAAKHADLLHAARTIYANAERVEVAA